MALREETVFKARGIYHKAYKAHHQRKARGRMSDGELKEWMERTSELKKMVSGGKMSLGEYEQEVLK